MEIVAAAAPGNTAPAILILVIVRVRSGENNLCNSPGEEAVDFAARKERRVRGSFVGRGERAVMYSGRGNYSKFAMFKMIDIPVCFGNCARRDNALIDANARLVLIEHLLDYCERKVLVTQVSPCIVGF